MRPWGTKEPANSAPEPPGRLDGVHGLNLGPNANSSVRFARHDSGVQWPFSGDKAAGVAASHWTPERCLRKSRAAGPLAGRSASTENEEDPTLAPPFYPAGRPFLHGKLYFCAAVWLGVWACCSSRAMTRACSISPALKPNGPRPLLKTTFPSRSITYSRIGMAL